MKNFKSIYLVYLAVALIIIWAIYYFGFRNNSPINTGTVPVNTGIGHSPSPTTRTMSSQSTIKKVNCAPGDQPTWIPGSGVLGFLGWSGHWACIPIPKA